MARPPIPPEHRKSFTISVRLTPAEGQLLADRAAAAGMTVTEFLRTHLPVFLAA
jgi:uncharacterized protein (DUF1778 family)